MNFSEFLFRLIVEVQNLFVVVGCHGVSGTGLGRGLRARLRLRRRRLHRRRLNILGNIIINSEPFSIQFILHANEAATVVYVIARGVEIRASFDGAFCYVEVEARFLQLHNLSIIIQCIFFVVDAFLELGHASENHDLLAGYLRSAGMHDSQFTIIRNIIDHFPHISFDIIRFDFLHNIEGKLVADSCFGPEALPTNNKNKFIIEVAHAECLSRMLKIGHSDPFFGQNREEFCRFETLDEGAAA